MVLFLYCALYFQEGVGGVPIKGIGEKCADILQMASDVWQTILGYSMEVSNRNSGDT